MSIKTFTVLTESQKGAANGLAELNGSGNVPSTQLPSYVDDVIEGTINSNNTVFTDSDGKTVTPESGKIYVDTTTNKSYRWSGTQYIVIASDLALGETDSTAYAGNKGKALADKIGTTDISGTGSTITEAIKSLDEDKLDKTGDSKDNTTTFTSSDVADGSATGWSSVPALTTGEKHTSIFSKMSQMFKNIRYLYKMLGTTDISAIGDGTATGAISSLNSNLDSYKSYISNNFLYRNGRGLSSSGWYRIMAISIINPHSAWIRLNFSIGHTWYHHSPTYIDFDVIIRDDVRGKQNICLHSIYNNTGLSYSKFRVYYSSTDKKYYIDIYYTRNYENYCGMVVTNKTSYTTNPTFSPQNFVSVDETIPNDCTMKLEYTFTADS